MAKKGTDRIVTEALKSLERIAEVSAPVRGGSSQKITFTMDDGSSWIYTYDCTPTAEYELSKTISAIKKQIRDQAALRRIPFEAIEDLFAWTSKRHTKKKQEPGLVQQMA
jgi:hypothetical protein